MEAYRFVHTGFEGWQLLDCQTDTHGPSNNEQQAHLAITMSISVT